MASRRNRTIDMPAPYLRRVWLDPAGIADRAAYPFCLPFLRDDFELSFDRPITIIAGENGTGKSTLLEGIAVLAGYDEAGGGKGHRSVDHSNALEVMGGELSTALRAGWLPKITNGWFFRAESFFSVARYQDKVNTEYIPGVPMGTPPDYLSHSHGEGFLRFFEERCKHSPMLMAYPGARLLRLSKYGLEPVTVDHTDHYKVMREFCADPAGFVEGAMAD
jgi:predicted ATPase